MQCKRFSEGQYVELSARQDYYTIIVRIYAKSAGEWALFLIGKRINDKIAITNIFHDSLWNNEHCYSYYTISRLNRNHS